MHRIAVDCKQRSSVVSNVKINILFCRVNTKHLSTVGLSDGSPQCKAGVQDFKTMGALFSVC